MMLGNAVVRIPLSGSLTEGRERGFVNFLFTELNEYNLFLRIQFNSILKALIVCMCTLSIWQFCF